MNDEKVKKTKKNKVKKNSTGPLSLNELLIVEEPPLSHVTDYANLATSYKMPIAPENATSYTDKDDDEDEEEGNRYVPIKYQKVIPIIIGD